MKSQPAESEGFIEQGGELPLSGPALAELLQAVTQAGKPFRFRAGGMSMSPFIKDGDVLTIAPLAGAAPHVGDVVAFLRCDEHVVVHRIVNSHDDLYTIQGDSLPAADDTVPRASIIGVVVHVQRHGRRVSLGMGPERRLIAALTRSGVLSRLIVPLWLRLRPIIRRQK